MAGIPAFRVLAALVVPSRINRGRRRESTFAIPSMYPWTGRQMVRLVLSSEKKTTMLLCRESGTEPASPMLVSDQAFEPLSVVQQSCRGARVQLIPVTSVARRP